MWMHTRLAWLAVAVGALLAASGALAGDELGRDGDPGQVRRDDVDLVVVTGSKSSARPQKPSRPFPNAAAIDSDGDGLGDLGEVAVGSSLIDPDTDDDGVSDGDEVNIWSTNPREADSDFDGRSDPRELGARTNPRPPDSDVDGLFDREELSRYFTEPPMPDFALDGLVDGLEVATHPAPTERDSDGDADAAGEVSAADHPAARELLVGHAPSRPTDLDLRDVNADGVCDLTDLALMGRGALRQR